MKFQNYLYNELLILRLVLIGTLVDKCQQIKTIAEYQRHTAFES